MMYADSYSRDFDEGDIITVAMLDQWRDNFRAGDSVVPTPPSWRCTYCNSSNDGEREECRGCRAPRPEG